MAIVERELAPAATREPPAVAWAAPEDGSASAVSQDEAVELRTDWRAPTVTSSTRLGRESGAVLEDGRRRGWQSGG